MPVYLSDKSCLDPAFLVEQCYEKGIPHGEWFGRANSFTLTLNCPGRGCLLLSRKDLIDLDLSIPPGQITRPLTFDDGETLAVLGGIVVVSYLRAVTPGAEQDETAAYVVEVADERWLHWDRGAKIVKAYNVRSSADGAYYSGTLNAGTAWTWAQMLTNLWPTEFQTEPALPFTPDGTPEGWAFDGMSKLQAYCAVLERICCALRYDPTKVEGSRCSVVRIGTQTTAATTLLATVEDTRLHDTYPLSTRYAMWPETVRVQFDVRPPYSDGTAPYYTIDQAVTTYTAQGIADGTVVVLRDDLFAQQSGGTVSNTSALTTRATERRTDWERKRRYFDTGRVLVYGGIRNLVTALGPSFGTLAWEDRGGGKRGGLKTTLVADGAAALEDWKRGRYPEVINGNMDIRSYRAASRWHCSDCVSHQHQDWGGTNRYGWTEAFLLVMAYTSRIILMPFILPVTATATKIGAQVRNKMATTRHVRLGLYKASNYPTDTYARTLVVDGGDVSFGTGYTDIQATISTTLAPGLYWIALGLPTDNMGNDPTDQINTGVAFNSASPNDTYSPLVWTLHSWPFGSIRRVNPTPLGSHLPGTFSSALGYHMAYPNAAASTAAQGPLPATLDAPTDVDGGANALPLIIPFLSLYLSSVTSAGGSGGAAGSSLPPADASYVVLSANSSLSSERVLTQGTDITITDGGANSTVTIAAAADRDVSGGTAP